MTWGINLGLDNATNAQNMANSILKAFSSSAVQRAGVTLDLLEIGELLPSNFYAINNSYFLRK
jgi:hypothetical protein